VRRRAHVLGLPKGRGMKSVLLLGALGLGLLAAVAMYPVDVVASSPARRDGRSPVDPSGPPPGRPLRLLFIHHSVGSQLLADPGPGELPAQHVNGGGFRKLLAGAGYLVHDATYGSKLGENTDMFDWRKKFSGHMDEILTTADGTSPLPGGAKHDVVMFKSCYPNNAFTRVGERGSPDGPELTVENAKAALSSLLPEFQKKPDTLFVYLTAPPLAAKSYPDRLWKWMIKRVIGRDSAAKRAEEGAMARAFNDWVVSPDGWLRGYPLRNVAAIDYYDLLTRPADSNFLNHPTGDGSDSHPASAGQKLAAPQVLAALNRAVQAAGLGAKTAPPEPVKIPSATLTQGAP
jgi:hypothetical protein